jgi:hypothetical protein
MDCEPERKHNFKFECAFISSLFKVFKRLHHVVFFKIEDVLKAVIVQVEEVEFWSAKF